MGLNFTLLLAVLANCLCPARPCIICDPFVTAAIKTLEKDYLPGHLEPEHHQDLIRKMETEVRMFRDLPINKNSYMGVVDEDTLEQASWSFLKDLKRITDSDVKGEAFVRELFSMIRLQKNIFASLVARFQKEVFCPNECGTMSQTLIWCSSCEKHIHFCGKSMDCGERMIEVHRSEDLVLDCLLSWHHASEGITDYSFYRVWGNRSETLLAKGKQPYLTKTMVGPEDAGYYRCDLDTYTAGPATIIYYNVTVLPPKPTEENVTEEDEGPETEPEPEPEPEESETEPNATVPKQPEKKLKSGLVILLVLGFVVLGASIAASVLYFRKSKVKLKSSKLDIKSSSIELKPDQESSPQIGSRKPSETELPTDTAEKDEESENQ